MLIAELYLVLKINIHEENIKLKAMFAFLKKKSLTFYIIYNVYEKL
jgi:hypothetical protein